MSAIASSALRVRGWRESKRPKHRLRGAEPIEMRQRRYGYFPQEFRWRGHYYHVNAVRRCWTVSRGSRGNRVERHCFRVCCTEGTFDLYQDVRHNTWHLKRQVS